MASIFKAYHKMHKIRSIFGQEKVKNSLMNFSYPDEDNLNEAGLDIKRVPHMMLMPYNYPSYASAAASSPYDSTSEDRRRKRTPFYLPSVTGRSSSPRGMRFYKNNWFKRDSTVGSEDEEPGQSPFN